MKVENDISLDDALFRLQWMLQPFASEDMWKASKHTWKGRTIDHEMVSSCRAIIDRLRKARDQGLNVDDELKTIKEEFGKANSSPCSRLFKSFRHFDEIKFINKVEEILKTVKKDENTDNKVKMKSKL